MKMPRTPFSTRLSGSAKETELRLRSIFQWKKKRPPVILFVLLAIMVIGCFGLFSVLPNKYKSIPDGAKVLDTLEISGSLFYAEDKGRFFHLYQAKEEGEPELLCVLSHWGNPNAKLKKLQLEQNEYILVEHVSRYPDGIWLRKTFTEVFYVPEDGVPVFAAQFEGKYTCRDYNGDGENDVYNRGVYVAAEDGRLLRLNEDGETVILRLFPEDAQGLLEGPGQFSAETAQELVRMFEGTVLSIFESSIHVYQP